MNRFKRCGVLGFFIGFRVSGLGFRFKDFYDLFRSEGFSEEVHTFGDSGVCLGMYNEDRSITDFARSCFMYSLKNQMPLYLSTKNTVLKTYDGRFKDIFQSVYEEEFQEKFKQANLWCGVCTAQTGIRVHLHARAYTPYEIE